MPAQLRSASAVLECWLAGNRVNTSVCNVLQVVWGKEMGKERVFRGGLLELKLVSW
jgi:hypothetical protein